MRTSQTIMTSQTITTHQVIMGSHLYFVDSLRHIWTNTSCNNAVYCFWLYSKDLECLPRSPKEKIGSS